jgi:hypothetical protein
VIGRFKNLHLVIVGVLMLSASIAVSAMQANAKGTKVKKVAIHASGTITLATTVCPEDTTGDECYSISGVLKQGSNNATLTGTLVTSSTPLTTKTTSCYTIINTTTETVTVGDDVADLSLTGEACIKTTKTASTETLTKGAWTTTDSSPFSGKGKQVWKITPADASSTTSPLAGSGTTKLTGSLEPSA